jgi:hypothetical protein
MTNTPPPRGTDLRESYRVRYPANYPRSLLPQIVVQPNRVVALEDWSEIGLRIRFPAPRDEVVGDVLTIQITLSGREPITEEGSIVWMDDQCVAIRLTPPTLPWKILLDEQRAIAKWRRTRAEREEEQRR